MRIRKNKIEVIAGTVYPFNIIISTETRLNKIIEYICVDLELDIDGAEDEDVFYDLRNYDGHTIRIVTGNILVQLNLLTPGTIAHEIFHAVTLLLDRVGIPFTKDTDEAYAYMISWLTDEFYKRFGY